MTTLTAPTGVTRLFAADLGPLPARAPAELLAELEASGLAGRGGAGFPTWRKLAALPRDARSRSGAVVIGNGAEGEPMSAKDATLLAAAPDLVIDGLLLCAAAVGASDVYLYAGMKQLGGVARAIAARHDARHIVLRDAPETFLSGEASAVVNAVETGRAIPREHVVRLAVAGLRGRPTLVQNVETLAQVALIARFGAQWFRGIGTADEPGTRLLSIAAFGSAPRVVEASGGVTIAEALRSVGIDPARQRAVLVGGYHGAWVGHDFLDTPLTRQALEPFGATPGAGILVALPTTGCGLHTSAQIVDYLATQSARQCGPCVNGLPAMATTLRDVAVGSGDPARVRELAQLVTGRGACHHPDGTARLVHSTLSTFASDVEAHRRGTCEALS